MIPLKSKLCSITFLTRSPISLLSMSSWCLRNFATIPLDFSLRFSPFFAFDTVYVLVTLRTNGFEVADIFVTNSIIRLMMYFSCLTTALTSAAASIHNQFSLLLPLSRLKVPWILFVPIVSDSVRPRVDNDFASPPIRSRSRR